MVVVDPAPIRIPSEPMVVVDPAPVRKRPARKPVKSPGRKFTADYVATARQSWDAGTEITPKWVREVSGCSKGLSAKVAATLTADLHAAGLLTTHPTTPDRPVPVPSMADEIEEAA
jgi:hypothetical protein